MKTKTNIIDICRKGDYKDRCQRLPINGCDGCWYHGVKIVEEFPTIPNPACEFW